MNDDIDSLDDIGSFLHETNTNDVDSFFGGVDFHIVYPFLRVHL